MIEKCCNAFDEAGFAELPHHRLDLALAGIERADQRLDVADVEVGLAHIGAHDPQDHLIENALIDQLHRRKADSFLMNFGQRPADRSRHCAAHVGVMDVASGPGDDLAVDENRLPQMRVGRMRGDMAGIRIVGEGEVAGPVVVDHRDRAVIGKPRKPGRTEFHRYGEGRA